jgi:hypothetical protein
MLWNASIDVAFACIMGLDTEHILADGLPRFQEFLFILYMVPSLLLLTNFELIPCSAH